MELELSVMCSYDCWLSSHIMVTLIIISQYIPTGCWLLSPIMVILDMLTHEKRTSPSLHHTQHVVFQPNHQPCEASLIAHSSSLAAAVRPSASPPHPPLDGLRCRNGRGPKGYIEVVGIWRCEGRSRSSWMVNDKGSNRGMVSWWVHHFWAHELGKQYG